MSTITLHTLTCFEPEDVGIDGDELLLRVYADGSHVETLERRMTAGATWAVNKTYSFASDIKITLYDDDWPDAADHLGTAELQGVTSPVPLGSFAFTRDDADYALTYTITVPSLPGAPSGPSLARIGLRQFLSRLGVGVMNDQRHQAHIHDNAIFRGGDEVISFQGIRTRHAPQDGAKSATPSVRQWIASHCIYFSPETIITDKAEYRNWAEVVLEGNWEPVASEVTRHVAGFAHQSRVTNTDNPISHETRDWTMNVIPDPTYMYLLGSGMKGTGAGLQFIPWLHNEWETGSFPGQWRPFWGEYVELYGRHIWDVGHTPVTAEFHPPHTVVRQHTTAAPIGNGGATVPVNQAIVGMGLSGGFPGQTADRWSAEFGGVPGDVWGDTTACWPTNLKKHPLTFRMVPPVPRPSPNAVLKTRIVTCKFIKVADWNEGDDFLELTQFDDPASGGEEKGFRDFLDAHGFPAQNCPASMKPTFTVGHDIDGREAFVDVSINLAGAPGIPVGYYTILECGWSEKGAHTLQQYEVEFETIKAIETDEWWDDWHLHYGVNGLWAWWWTADFIKKDETYTRNQTFTFWTVDDLPIVIRDCGVEWDGTDYGNEQLDEVELIITPSGPGYNHLVRLGQIAAADGQVDLVSPAGGVTPAADTVRITVRGSGGDTRHEWRIRVRRTAVA